jgi:hypothetical protein
VSKWGNVYLKLVIHYEIVVVPVLELSPDDVEDGGRTAILGLEGHENGETLTFMEADEY